MACSTVGIYTAILLVLADAGVADGCGRAGFGVGGPGVGRAVVVPSACACLQLCADDPVAQAWQWISNPRNSDYRTCYLKSTVDLQPNSASVSGCLTKGGANATAKCPAPPPPPPFTPGQVVKVKDGYVVGSGEFVGLYTSLLVNNVISKMFQPVTPADWQSFSMIDSTRLRYLQLDGIYQADVPLQLPSLFVLQLAPAAVIVPAANLTMHNTSTFTGLIEMKDVHFSAVLGGTVDASSLNASAFNYPYQRGYQAVAIKGGSNNAIRGVRAAANNSDGALGVTQSPHSEIANCNVGGSPANSSAQTVGRCIWILATSHALVHDNHVHHCKSHALDFDAYTSTSAAYNNLCEDNGEEGIFVEETANGNFIFNNTCRRNSCGIGLEANAVGPVANNMIINNYLQDNRGNAITAGGSGPRTGLDHASTGNIFASNVAVNNLGHNGGQYDVHHGLVINDYWTGNTAVGNAPAWCAVPENVSEVVVFDPDPV